MTTLEVQQYNQQESQHLSENSPHQYHENSLKHVTQVALRVLGFMPIEAPIYMSEHFGQAEKHNNPNPPLTQNGCRG
ncbi:MAG: hypothetical protein NVSMB46_00100 [Candidatus Saccharimonadales bacterium]